MGRWNGHKCEFISSLIASFYVQNNKNGNTHVRRFYHHSVCSHCCCSTSITQQSTWLRMQSVGESCIGAIDEEKEEEIRGANMIMFNGIDWRLVACGCRTTQQPTAKLNREGIDRICVAIWRAIKHRNTTISPTTVIEVDAQLTIVLLCLKDT